MSAEQDRQKLVERFVSDYKRKTGRTVTHVSPKMVGNRDMAKFMRAMTAMQESAQKMGMRIN